MNTQMRTVFFRRIPVVFILAAVLMCSIQSGAMRWQHCIVPLVLLCTAIIINKFKSTGILTDALVLLSLISCILSVLFTESDMQEAIHESLKYFCFCAAFYAAVSVPKEDILKICSVAGVLIAFAGIFSYCNIIRASEFVFNDRGVLRLQSFIKYANTAAVFLGCAYFSLCGTGIKNKKLDGLLKIMVLSAFYLTVSKAAIPFFIFIGILYMIKTKDADFAVHNAVCIIFIIPAILLVRYHMFTQCLLLIIIWIAAGTALSGKFGYSKKLSAICLSSVCVAATAAVILLISGKYDIFSTFMYRLKYMRDATSLLFRSFFGTGPASWQLMQFGVQQEQYSVTYIHNGWLQFLVENGAVFFVSFVAVVVISAYRMFKSQSWYSLASLIFISAHAFIDIDFGFALILVVTGLLCGAEAKPVKSLVLPAIILALCTVSAGYATTEYFVRMRFETAYIEKDYPLALQNARILEKICPGDSNVQLAVANLSGENVEERILKAMKLSPYDMNIAVRYVNFRISNYEKDIPLYLEKLIHMAPKQEDTYTTVKQLAQQAYIYGCITEEEFNDFMEKTDSVMEKEGVIDRNRLLEDISK